MWRRFALRALVLTAILAACLGLLVLRGLRARRTVAENLPHPSLSTGKREIDLWHPTLSAGRVYDFTWAWPADRPPRVPDGARLEVQLASGGRTRLVVVQAGHPTASPTWGDVLRGRVRLQVVGDREWVDLGPLPGDGSTLEAQVYGLLPGSFGFSEPWTPSTEHFSFFRLRRPDAPLARPARALVRYRFRVADPVAPGETLARAFFFVSASRVLLLALAAGIVLLYAGWFWLFDGRVVLAVACLVPAVTFLHAALLAPFQGADEATHAGTVEAVLFEPALLGKPEAYPESLALLYERIGYATWAGSPETPVPVARAGDREALRRFFSRTLAEEARRDAGRLPDAVVMDPSARAPLYYNAFRLAGPILRTMGVLDRVSAYVVLSAAASLMFFLAGLAVLARAAEPRAALLYGFVALWPYSVGVVASCSNYSAAIGLGQLLAAIAVAGILASDSRAPLAASAAFSCVAAIGVAIWDDFVFFVVPALVVTSILAVRLGRAARDPRRRRLATAAALAAGAAATGVVLWALVTGEIRRLVSSLGARLPKELSGLGDPSFWLLAATASAPLVASLVAVLASLRARDWDARTRRRAAAVRTAILAALAAVLFLATPWTPVPFERTRLDYPDEVFAHGASFFSNAFAFDQDVLSWQMYVGVFGYADVSYPMLVYAVARWAFVLFLVALPALSWAYTQRDWKRSALLLSLTGAALAVCVVTNSLRYFALTNPWGRFVLPAVPLAALPLLIRASALRARPWVAALTALHLWTALVLLGGRYALGL